MGKVRNKECLMVAGECTFYDDGISLRDGKSNEFTRITRRFKLKIAQTLNFR